MITHPPSPQVTEGLCRNYASLYRSIDTLLELPKMIFNKLQLMRNTCFINTVVI